MPAPVLKRLPLCPFVAVAEDLPAFAWAATYSTHGNRKYLHWFAVKAEGRGDGFARGIALAAGHVWFPLGVACLLATGLGTLSGFYVYDQCPSRAPAVDDTC